MQAMKRSFKRINKKMYKELIYETKEFAILKIHERVCSKNKIITSYPYQKGSLKVVFYIPDRGEVGIEYITKIDKLPSVSKSRINMW